jgi:ferritin heavy chain
VLHSILKPVSEFEHGDKGDALYGMFLLSRLMFIARNCLISWRYESDPMV